MSSNEMELVLRCQCKLPFGFYFGSICHGLFGNGSVWLVGGVDGPPGWNFNPFPTGSSGEMQLPQVGVPQMLMSLGLLKWDWTKS